MSSSDPSRVWLPELVERFAKFMPGNDVSCSLRLVNKATAAQFRRRSEYTTVRLSQQVPPTPFAQRWTASDAMRELTWQQRHKLLCLTAASGSIQNMEVALANVGIVLDHHGRCRILDAAAGAGRLQMCKWLLQRGYSVSMEAFRAAATSGHRAICELLLPGTRPLHPNYVYAAALGGHFSLMEWLLQVLQQQHREQQGMQCSGATAGSGPSDAMESLSLLKATPLLEAAASGFDLPTLQSLYRRFFGEQEIGGDSMHAYLITSMLQGAAKSPASDWQSKVEWLETLLPTGYSGHKDRVEVCGSAASTVDAVARLKWLQQRGYVLGSEGHYSPRTVLYQAESNRKVDVLQWLLSEGIDPCRICLAALRCGAVQALPGLQPNRFVLEPYRAQLALLAAVESRELSQLQWVVESLGVAVPRGDGQQDAYLMADVAGSNNIAMLAWLYERGCPLRQSTFTAAADRGCMEALEWLAERHCPMGREGAAYVRAAEHGDLATLRCLQRLGCPWGPPGKVFTQCVASPCEVPVLRCLAELGCAVLWDKALRATNCHGPTDVPAWLAEQRKQWLQEREERVAQRRQRQPPPPPRQPPLPRPESPRSLRERQQQRERQERAERRDEKRRKAC